MTNILKNEENVPNVCIFMGKSGCGKGTQVELYIEKLKEINGLKTLHIETGSLLREMAKDSSYSAQIVKNVMETGGLMPESVVICLWTKYLIDNFTGKENLVFDGTSRRLFEAEILDRTLAFYNIKKYNVVYINVSNEWAAAKLLGRGRKDDTKEVIENRLSWFEKDTMPSIRFFQNTENCEFIDINGEQTKEQVRDELMEKVFPKY